MKNLFKIGLLALLLIATPVAAQIVPAQNQLIPSAYFGAGVLISTSTSPTHKITAVATSTLFAPGTFFAYPFPLTGNATSTLTQFNGGLTAFASSTIGNGTQTGGLTVSGGATTTGVLAVSQGTVSAPGLSFVGDPTAGIYRNGTGAVALSGAGAGATWNGSAFYPNTDNTRTLGLVNNRWLNYWGSGTATTSIQYITSLATPAGTILAVDALGKVIATTTPTGSGGSAFPFTPTTNYGVAVNSTSTPIWFTSGLMASSTSYFPLGVWNSSGNVGIGTSTPVSKLQVADDTSAIFTLSDMGASENQKHWFIESDGGRFKIGTTSDALTTDTPRSMQILPSGDIGFNKIPTYAFDIGGANSTDNIGLFRVNGTYTGNASLGNNVIDLSPTMNLNAAGGSITVVRSAPTINPTVDLNGVTNGNNNMAFSSGSNNITAATLHTGALQLGASFSGNVGTLRNYNAIGISNSGAGTVTNFVAFIAGNISGATNNVGLQLCNANVQAGTFGINTLCDFPNIMRASTTAESNYPLAMYSARAGIVSGDSLGNIGFLSNDTNLTAPGALSASIGAMAAGTHNATNRLTDLVFRTTDTGGAATTEKVRITGAGNLGIGTTSPSRSLSVQGNLYTSDGAFFGGAILATSTLTLSALSDGCLQVSSGLVTSIGSACGTGGFAFPFTPQSDGNATSTNIIFKGGLLSTASSTINADLVISSTTVQRGKILTFQTSGSTNNDKFLSIQNSSNAERMSLGYASTDVGLNINNRSGTALVSFRENGNVGIATTSPGSILSIEGVANFVASGISSIYNSLRILGTLILPSLATPAGSFLAVDASGNVIATTTPSGGGSTVTPYSVKGGSASDEYTELTTINVTAGDVVMFWANSNANSGCSATTFGINLVYKVGSWPATTTEATDINSAGTGAQCSVAAQGIFTATTTDTIKIAITRAGIIGSTASSIMAQLIEN